MYRFPHKIKQKYIKETCYMKLAYMSPNINVMLYRVGTSLIRSALALITLTSIHSFMFLVMVFVGRQMSCP